MLKPLTMYIVAADKQWRTIADVTGVTVTVIR